MDKFQKIVDILSPIKVHISVGTLFVVIGLLIYFKTDMFRKKEVEEEKTVDECSACVGIIPEDSNYEDKTQLSDEDEPPMSPSLFNM